MDAKVITHGRTDLDAYFERSGIREQKKLSHTPFLVFIVNGDTVEVKVVDSARQLLTYPDETQVMAQWSGQYRSDFFQFRVGQLREYVTKNPASSHHVV